jgi:transcriptional regulator with XRE-family HTH domain
MHPGVTTPADAATHWPADVGGQHAAAWCESAEHAGLRAHGTLVQYENGNVLPPLDRLAALAQAYDVPLASLMVSHDALMPMVTMLEHATNRQIDAFTQLLRRAIDDMPDDAAA